MRPCFGLLLAFALNAADIGGSDLLSPLAAGLTKAGATSDFAGTLPAARAYADGRLGAVLLMERSGGPAAKDGPGDPPPFTLASSAAVVVVHRSNAVTQLTLPQLADAFARDRRDPLTHWSGLPGGRSELVSPALCSPEGHFVRELLTGLVCPESPLRPDVRQGLTPEAAAQLAASRSDILLLIAQPPAGVGRILPVADGREGRPTSAYLPTPENVHAGDYPLRLPIVLHVRKDRARVLRPALAWLCSDEAADILRQRGLHPAPVEARRRWLLRLDTP